MVNWASSIKDKPKLDFLAILKPALGVEPFVKLNMSKYERSLLAQLRYGILPLQLETGRYNNEARENRFCRICNEGIVEDQYHFVFYCSAYNEKRDTFTNIMENRIPGYSNMNDDQKFVLLFKENSRALGRYVKDLFLYRKNLLYK